jgi:CMP-N-acetylneuraminic acid synthetase
MAAPAGMTPAAAGASKGFIASAMASPYFAPAVVTSGTQLIGGVMQGYGARQEQKRQEQMAADQKATYNRNIGGFRY